MLLFIIQVDLIYVVLNDYDAIMRRAVFRNVSELNHTKVVHRAFSLTVDFESTSTPFYLVQLR